MQDPEESHEIAKEITIAPSDLDRFQAALQRYLVCGLPPHGAVAQASDAAGPGAAAEARTVAEAAAPVKPGLFNDEPEDPFDLGLPEVMTTAAASRSKPAHAFLFDDDDDDEQAWARASPTAPPARFFAAREPAPDEDEELDSLIATLGVTPSPGSSSGGGGGGGGSVWACRTCTFENTGGQACSMCDAPCEPSAGVACPNQDNPAQQPQLRVQVGKNRAVHL